MKTRCLLALTVGLLTAAAWAQPYVEFECTTADPDVYYCHPKCGGEVGISGATLFNNFFKTPASTNDYINANCNYICIDPDCDGDLSDQILVPYAKYLEDPIPGCMCNGDSWPYVEQLAKTWSYSSDPGNPFTTWWLVHYRGVGSGNGLAEFVRSQLDVDPNYTGGYWVPTNTPADGGWLNRFEFGAMLGPSPYPLQTQVNIAVMDVPTTWFVTIDGTADWTRNPADPGYGNNPTTSWDATQGNKLKSLSYNGLSLNTNRGAAADANTVYDSQIAWVPIAVISNRGTDLENATAQELQVLFLTGRLANGKNLVACTRDSGSGTRNGAMNTLCIDPSWGVGDNLDKKDADEGTKDRLGPIYQPTHKSGSSRMEDTVTNTRLGVGYTGLLTSSRAEGDHKSGKYELTNVMFNQHEGACCVGTSCTYATAYDCTKLGGVFVGGLCADVICTGSEVATGGCVAGGSCTLESEADCAALSGTYLGDNTFCYVRPSIAGVLINGMDSPNAWTLGGNETMATRGDPAETAGEYPMMDSAAKDYLNNIRQSVADFSDPNGIGDPNTFASPGQLLAGDFTLAAALNYVPDLFDPCRFIENADFVQELQDWTLIYNTPTLYPYGTRGSLVPNRLVMNPASLDPNWNWPTETQCDCAYPANGYYSDGTNGEAYLNRQGGANLTAGQFLNDRNVIAGDFDGNGVCDVDDIDDLMLAIYDVAAYVAADQAAGRSSSGNPVVVEIIGDFNGDGNFDCRDVRYFADGLAMEGGVLNRAAGFLRVDQAWFALTGDDNYFGTTVYDCSGSPIAYTPGAAAADMAGRTPYPGAYPHGYDCRVDCTDAQYIKDNYGNFGVDIGVDLSCDLTGDLVIDSADLAAIDAIMGCSCFGPTICAGDANCDGAVNFFDIDPFVVALTASNDASVWQNWLAANGYASDCDFLNNDTNGDSSVDFFDIDPFVTLLSTGATCP